MTDADSVVRTAAAQMIPTADGDRVGSLMRTALADEDGHVREAAVKRLKAAELEDTRELLISVASAGEPGWLCWDCGASNPAGRFGCSGDDCVFGGPSPSKLAGQILKSFGSAGEKT